MTNAKGPLKRAALLSIYVRKTGLEPVRPCERHPLKMVRLPISPLPQRENKHTEQTETGKGLSVR